MVFGTNMLIDICGEMFFLEMTSTINLLYKGPQTVFVCSAGIIFNIPQKKITENSDKLWFYEHFKIWHFIGWVVRRRLKEVRVRQHIEKPTVKSTTILVKADREYNKYNIYIFIAHPFYILTNPLGLYYLCIYNMCRESWRA